MKALSCVTTRRLLSAFHDRELATGDEIAVAAHLEWCDGCAGMATDLRMVGAALRANACRGAALSNDEAAGFGTAVVTRLKAEQDASLAMRVRLMFDDMHLVYASAGAITSAMICVVMMLGMMRLAADNRPDSLGAIVNVLATPLECETGVEVAETGCRSRWAERFQRSNEAAEEDAVFTLDSVVMRQGRLPSLAVLRSRNHRSTSDQVEMIEGLLDAVYRARLELQPAGLSESMLRVVDHATVRANKQQAIDLPLPPALKKRAASQPSAHTIIA